MPMAKSMIVLLLFSWSSGLIDTNQQLKRSYFNRKTWFEHGPVFRVESPVFWNTFPQHRNVTQHLRWLNTEIASLNRQIRLVKEQLLYIVHPEKKAQDEKNSSRSRKNLLLKRKPSIANRAQSRVNISSIPVNQRNLLIIKSLAYDPLFDGLIPQLIDLYRFAPLRTIECVALIIDQKSQIPYIFIRTSNGDTDGYQISSHRPMKEMYFRLNEPISTWNDADKQLHYYRRFIPDRSASSLALTDQYAEIKNRPKSGEAYFFEMMGPVLRMKYHVDPSSLSCILETYFGQIYTCDGRIVHPHELKLLSDDNSRFVFYAVMIDTKIERQIFPLGTNNQMRDGEQIYYLFPNHPQYSTAPSPSCTTCFQYEQTIAINSDQETVVEIDLDSGSVEQKPAPPAPTPAPPAEPERSTVIHSQNYIVYTFVASLVVYIFYSIYLGRRQQKEEEQTATPVGCQGKKHSTSCRRTR